VIIDPTCPSRCAESVSQKPLKLEKHFLYGSDDYRVIDYFLPVFPPFFVFFFTFIISTVTFHRERVRGTLERLLIAPVSFAQVILGYVAGFFIFSSCQAVIILAFIISLLGFEIVLHQLIAIVVLTLVMMLISLIMGLLASFLAANEFQALQFIPLVILPQLFLSDIIWSIEAFPRGFPMDFNDPAFDTRKYHDAQCFIEKPGFMAVLAPIICPVCLFYCVPVFSNARCSAAKTFSLITRLHLGIFDIGIDNNV